MINHVISLFKRGFGGGSELKSLSSSLFSRTGILLLCLFVPIAFGFALDLETAEIGGKKCLVLKNDQTLLALDVERFTLVSFRDLAQKIEYVAEPGGSLFSITYLKMPTEFYLTHKAYSVDGGNAKKRWHEVRAGKGEGETELLLHYDGCSVGENGATVNITVSISMRPNESSFFWGLEAGMIGAKTEIRFPTLRGMGSSLSGSSDSDFFACGDKSDEKFSKPRSTLTKGVLIGAPAKTNLKPFCFYGDGLGKGGIYFSTLDHSESPKSFACRSMISKKSFVFSTYYLAPTVTSESWALPYTIGIGPIRGKWENAVQKYRDAAVSQEQPTEKKE